MGAVAVLTDAVIWAFTSTLITSRLTRIDFLSVATFRMTFAAAFVWAALFVLGGESDLWNMSFHTMWPLALSGVIGYALGEPGYALTLALLGLTRGYTIIIGVFSLAAFVFPVIFLDESVSWQSIMGGVLIVTGVVVVTFRGRAPTPVSAPALTAAATRPIAGGALPDPSAEPPQRSWLLRYRLTIGILAAAGLAGLLLRYRANTQPPEPDLHYDPVPTDQLPGPHSTNGVSTETAAAPAPTPPTQPTHIHLPGTPFTLPRLLAGLIIAVTTALLWASSLTILRALSPGIDDAAVATTQITPAALGLLAVFLIARRGRIFSHGATPTNASLMGLTGLMTAGFGTILIVFAIERIGAGPVAVLFAMSTIFAMPLGVIFLKERVTIWGAGGAALAVGGVALLV